MSKCYAVYRILSFKYNDVRSGVCFFCFPGGIGEFACDLGNLTDSQLEELQKRVGEKHEIYISKNWNAEQYMHGVILLVKDSNFDDAVQIDLEYMKKQYEQAMEDFGVVAKRLIPLKHCINVAEHLVRNDRETQDVAKTFSTPIADVTADCLRQVQAATGVHVSDTVKSDYTEIGDTTGNPLHTSECPDSPLVKAINELPSKVGRELQDAWAMFNDPPDENELEYAKRLRRTSNKTYAEIAALVGERFPDGKYKAGDGENIRKALNPAKTNTKNRK